MRVVFLEVDTERAWGVAAIGPGYLAAHLRRHGHQAWLERARLGDTAAELARRIADHRPGLIGVSLSARQWLRARALVAELRATLGVPVIAGGLHPTFAPEPVLASPGFDYVCLGEGEQPLLDLARALDAGDDPGSIPNIWCRGGARPTLRPPFEPIDGLAFPARDILDEPPGVIHMVSQRGCSFRCTYCAAHSSDQLYADAGCHYQRRRSPGNVIDELAERRRAGQLAYVIFLDDTFTVQPRWVRELCARYRTEIRAPFSIHARVETVTPELLAALAEAGCQQITYGVESGSERVRRHIMNRKVSDRHIRDAFARTRDAGIAVTANYMLGLPGETRAELEQTVALAAELEVLDLSYFVFYPFPGTHLYRLCRDRGYLPDDYLERPANHRESILDLPDLTPADIADAYDRLTDLRRQIYRRRLGPGAGEAEIEAALGHVGDSAATA